uniref:Uncharacterized protein n=1 Tax=Cynoglossus semilaevis TaxID=244447 RepID=A0A3P8WJT8_CYNSE
SLFLHPQHPFHRISANETGSERWCLVTGEENGGSDTWALCPGTEQPNDTTDSHRQNNTSTGKNGSWKACLCWQNVPFNC